MSPIVPAVICLAVGAAAGALAVWALLRPKLSAAQNERSALQQRLHDAESAQLLLADMRVQASSLRHDLRGILSPALLSADRLSNSQDPATRKAADIVIRSVERAATRLADKATVQDSANSDFS
jgi:signal transduction histidine kinase